MLWYEMGIVLKKPKQKMGKHKIRPKWCDRKAKTGSKKKDDQKILFVKC